MPITILISPVLFVMAGRFMDTDITKSLWILGIGIVMILFGIVECNIKDKT